MPEINITKKEEKELFLKALFGSPFFNIFASVLATFIVGAVFFKYGGGVPINVTSSTTEQVSAFEVAGEARVTVIPDEARVRLGMRKEGREVADLQEQVNQTMQVLIERVKGLGVSEEDIRTVNYSVSPNYGPRSEEALSLYVAYAEIEVRVRELEKTGQVLDLVGQLGLNQVGGVSFGLSKELEEETMRQAREMAIEEAKSKAKELALLAGMRLGKIVNVKESSNLPQPYLMRAEGVALDTDGEVAVPTPVEPGSSEINVSITLVYETL